MRPNRPASAATLILCLTLCSVISCSFLQPHRREILVVSTYDQVRSDSDETASLTDFVSWKMKSHSIQDIAFYQVEDLGISIDGKETRIQGCSVSDDFFKVLGMEPVLGRAFLEDESKMSVNSVALITHRLWRDSFKSDPAVIGRTIRIDRSDYTVIGVAPQSFEDLGDCQVIRLFNPGAYQGSPTDRVFKVVATLKPGVKEEELRVELASIQNLRRAAEGPNRRVFDAKITPFRRL